jgi:hypothetical protein
MPRPRLVPTEEQRKKVKTLAAYGARQNEIARFIDVRSPKTLRKYFREELKRGELEGYVKVEQTLYGMATDGKHPYVTQMWLASYARRQGHGPETGASANPPVFMVAPVEESVDAPVEEKRAA